MSAERGSFKKFCCNTLKGKLAVEVLETGSDIGDPKGTTQTPLSPERIASAFANAFGLPLTK